MIQPLIKNAFLLFIVLFIPSVIAQDQTFTCGDNTCETDKGETAENCPYDCQGWSCGDGICETDKGETLQLCQQDCAPKEEPAQATSSKLSLTWIIAGGALALIIIGIAMFFIFRKRKQEPQAPVTMQPQEQPANEQPQNPVQQ